MYGQGCIEPPKAATGHATSNSANRQHSRLASNMLQISPIILFRTAPITYPGMLIDINSRKLPRLQVAALTSRWYLHFLLISAGFGALQYL